MARSATMTRATPIGSAKPAPSSAIEVGSAAIANNDFEMARLLVNRFKAGN